MADDATLVINADANPLLSALSQAQSATARATSEMAGSFGQLTNTLGSVGKAFGALTAVLAGGAAFKAAVGATLEWESGAGKLAKALGTTTERASVYQTALQHLGIDSSVLVDATGKMSKAIGSNEEAFQKLGIATRDSSGHFLAAGDVLTETIARLQQIKNPIDQNIVGMQLFGRGWAEIRPLMKLTADTMAEAEKRAKDLGLIVGPQGAAQARAYKEGMNDVSLVAKAFQIQIGNALIPTLTQLGAAFSSEGPTMAKTFATALTGVAVVVETLWNSFQKLSLGVGAYVAAYAAILSGDKQAAKDIWKAYGEDVDALNKKLADFYEKIANPPPPPKGSPMQPDGDGGNAADLLNKDKRKQTIEELADYAIELDTRVTSEHARLMEQQFAKDQQQVKEREHQLDELSDYAQELDTRVTGEHARAVAEMTKLNQKQANEIAQQWQKTGDRMARALDGAFKSMLNGSFTWAGLMRNVVENVGTNMINMFARGATSFLANEAKKAAAAQAGGDAQAAAQGDASKEGLAAGGTSALKKIVNDAYQAASGAYSALVGIPYIGPVIAPAGAAVAFAAVTAFESGIVSASQGFDIPKGSNPLVQAHSGEMILPEKQADVVRDMANRGPSTVHIHGGRNSTFTQDQLAAMLRQLGHRFKLV